MLDIKTLETWLWNAACSIRGSVDAPKFKDYILPLVFVKRLSDVFEKEADVTGKLLNRIHLQTPVWRCSGSPKGSSSFFACS